MMMHKFKESLEKPKDILNIIPLKNMLMVPQVIIPILIGRNETINSVENALMQQKSIICLTQKNSLTKYPKYNQLYRVGTLCNILQVFRLPEGSYRILIEGQKKVKISRLIKNKLGYFQAYYNPLNFDISGKTGLEAEAFLRSFKHTFVEYIRGNPNIPLEVSQPLKNLIKPVDCFFYAIANIEIDIEKKQKLFQSENIYTAINNLLKVIRNEIEIFKLEKKIDKKVNVKLNKIQREYYLREQLKAIQKELGGSEKESSELVVFKKKISKLPLSKQVKKIAENEIKKLSNIPEFSQEYIVSFNYLKWIVDLPWKEFPSKSFKLSSAKKILDKNHYGLKKVKDVLLEYLSIVQFTKKNQGKILCFVGPAGVGKTSLGRSIAKALNRKFVRLSLGGVRDEAEIRGHRRTYVGSMPGVIINSMKRAGTTNPVVMMDEIDKMSTDFRGDPSSALLEVLDSEQNNSFRDHYLDFDYDLSGVFFITTANTISTIPLPLLDRMEVVRLPGYTIYEKMKITKNHLLPREEDSLEIKKRIDIDISEKAIRKIIESYTREAGVRNIERALNKIFRKIIRKYIEDKKQKKFSITKSNLRKYLGVPKFDKLNLERKNRVGVSNGLAWTEFGGEILYIEVEKSGGSGKIKLTGNLGDVMRESAQAAYTYARVHYKKYSIVKDFYKKNDIHLHVPEGSVPKDGPSAGVSIITAIISALSGKKVRSDIAMTGEITLSGNVLPIGGLPEKLIAARQAGIKKVLIPYKNRVNLSEISKQIKSGMEIITVKKVSEVLNYSLI